MKRGSTQQVVIEFERNILKLYFIKVSINKIFKFNVICHKHDHFNKTETVYHSFSFLSYLSVLFVLLRKKEKVYLRN